MRKTLLSLIFILSFIPIFTCYASTISKDIDNAIDAYLNGEITPAQKALLQSENINPEEFRGTDNTGGPDAFGYNWIDSHEPELSYNWIDTTANHIVIDDLLDDCVYGPFEIGFSFPFYGEIYNNFYINSNGVINFDGYELPFTNYALPYSDSPSIAILWTDLDPYDESDPVYIENVVIDGIESVVITFMGYDEYPGGQAGEITMQTILQEDGTVVLQYSSIEDGFEINSCTIGIQNGHTIASQVLYNGSINNYPHNNLAIKFYLIDPNASLSGTVSDSETGLPIENAEVSVRGQFCITDVNGFYEFESLYSGVNTITINAANYEYISEDILLLEGANIQNFIMEFVENPVWMEYPYFWIDISTTGMQVAIGDDVSSEVIFGDFGLDAFTYYGIEYDQIHICSNGFASFTSNSTSWTPNELPDISQPNATLALCWDDLHGTLYDAHILIDAVDNKLVISYLDVNTRNLDMVMNAQIVLDFNSDLIFYNYQSFEFSNPPYTGSHSIGFENENGAYGQTIYFGDEWNYPANETSFMIGHEPGYLVGTVVDLDPDEPIEGCEVTAYSTLNDDISFAGITDENGFYSIILPEGIYDVQTHAVGYFDATEEDVVVISGETTTINFALGFEPPVWINGSVVSAENPDIHVENMIVTVFSPDGTFIGSATTNHNGLYLIEEFLEEGEFNFYLSHDPVGSQGYHDLTVNNFYVDETGGANFSVHEILSPANFTASPLYGAVELTWDLPPNAVTVTSVMLNKLEAQSQAATGTMKQDFYQDKYNYCQNLYVSQQSELDELSDLYQFYIADENYTFVDSVRLDEINDYSLLIESLTNCQPYYFAIAADYGYGPENLVYSDLLEVIPYGTMISFEETDYDWYDVRNDPNMTAMNLDDDGEYWISFDTTFEYFNLNYSGIVAGSNGGLTFDPEGEVPYSSGNLPSNFAPNAFLAPFWIDFNPAGGDDYDVYYTFDTDGNLWVEWYVPYFGTENVANFEVKLDFATYTITYQYNSADVWESDATIGYQDETGTFGGMWPVQNVIDAGNNGYALNLVYDDITYPASIEGYVLDNDLNVLEGVNVVLNDSTLTTTNEDGYYYTDLPIGNHELTFVKTNYSSENIEINLDVCENLQLDDIILDEIEVSVNPEELQIDVIVSFLWPEWWGEETITLTNMNQFPLTWHAELELISFPDWWGLEFPLSNNSNTGQYDFIIPKRDESTLYLDSPGPVNSNIDEIDETWDYIFGIELATATNVAGAVVVNNAILVTENGNDSHNNFYIYGLDGILYYTEELPTDLQGLCDLAWDGDYLYGGIISSGNIYRFNPYDLNDCELIASIPGYGRGIAYDIETGDLYVSDWNTLARLSNEGGIYIPEILTYPAAAVNCYGCAWMPNDPDGKNLWLFCQPDNSVVYRVNPETMEIDEGTLLYQSEWGTAGGIDISNGYDYTMMNVTTVLQAEPPYVDIWEGYEYRNWFANFVRLNDRSGQTGAGESDDITIIYNMEDSEELLYDAEIFNGDEMETMLHINNSEWDGINVPITFTFWIDKVDEKEGLLPDKYALHQNYPNPFNPLTSIKFDLVEAQNVKLSVFNILGQQVAELVNQQMEAGFHSVSFDATSLSSGIYFYRIETVAFTDLKKMVLVR